MTLIAVVGEFGFDRVVGVAEYLVPHGQPRCVSLLHGDQGFVRQTIAAKICECCAKKKHKRTGGLYRAAQSEHDQAIQEIAQQNQDLCQWWSAPLKLCFYICK